MEKRISIAHLTVVTLCLCVLRWTQIIHFTDPSTGALTQITWLSQALYLLLLELIVVTFWLAARERKAGALVCFVQPRFGLFQAVGGGVLLISVLVGLAQVLLGKDQTAADLQTMAALLPYHMGIWVIRIVTYLLYLLGAVAGIVCVVEGIVGSRREEDSDHPLLVLLPCLFSLLFTAYLFLAHSMIFSRPDRLLPLFTGVFGTLCFFRSAKCQAGIEAKKAGKTVRTYAYLTVGFAVLTLLPQIVAHFFVSIATSPLFSAQNGMVLALGLLAFSVIVGTERQKQERREE